jgi:uncharacterized protein (TIGR03086 family)
MTDTAVLRDVLDATGEIVAGVRDDQLDEPTPCSDWTVGRLRSHIVGWTQVFAAGASSAAGTDGPDRPEQPDEYAGSDPAGDFRAAADAALAAFGELSDDTGVTVSSGETPAGAVASMMTGEYLAHGWDLATATGQPVPYTAEQADAAREGLLPLLDPKYRGDGMPFGNEIEVAANVSRLDKFLAFIGRDPAWARA